jgi:hypothetical protein
VTVTNPDWQLDKLERRLERVGRIAHTMHRIADSNRLAGNDAQTLRDHATVIAHGARDALTLLRTREVATDTADDPLARPPDTERPS